MKRFCLLTSLFLACCMMSFAETEAEILNKISQNGRAVTTITCKFAQRKHVNVIKDDVLSNGHFYYQKSDKVCMNYDNPKGDLLLMNGDDFVMVTAGKRSVANAQANPMLKQMRIMLTACVSGDFERLKMGKGTQISVSETAKQYVLTIAFSGSAKKYYSTIVMTFEKSDLSLSILRMNEASGNFTEYTFTEKSFNKNIDEKVFIVKQ